MSDLCIVLRSIHGIKGRYRGPSGGALIADKPMPQHAVSVACKQDRAANLQGV